MSSNLINLDLHTHPLPTLDFFKRLIEYCTNKNMNVIAITDVKDERYAQFREYTGHLPLSDYKVYLTERGFVIMRDKDLRAVKFIRGQEVFTKEGHVLTVGSTKRILNHQSLEDTLKRAKDYNAIIVADHPFVPEDVWGGIGEKNLEKYLDYYDAIEWNAQCINLFPFPKYLMQVQANEKAEQFSKEHNLPLIADSDAHLIDFGSLNQIGLAYVQLPEFRYTNDENFIVKLRNKIKNNEHTNVKKTISRLGFLRWCIPLYVKKLFSGMNGHNPKTVL